MAAHRNSRDILSRPLFAVGFFWLPPLAMVATGNVHVSNAWRTAIWTLALTTMGGACMWNAIRCGRVHCYATGPFFLVMAIITFCYGLGLVSLGAHGWNEISLATLVGALSLYYLPELFLGKYRARGSR